MKRCGKDHLEAAYRYPREASQVPQEYIDDLNSRTITEWGKGRFYFAVDFMPTSDNLDFNFGCLAVAYVTALEHLNANFSGEKLERYKIDFQAITRAIDRENERIRKMYDAPYYDKEADPVYDASAIRAMSEKILLLYNERERNYAEAILKGIELARNASDRKQDPNNVVERYRDNSFWSHFYDNSSRLSSKYYVHIPGDDTRTDFCKLVASWNDFASEISKSRDFQLNSKSQDFRLNENRISILV